MTTIDTPPPVAPAAGWRFPVAQPFSLANGIEGLAYHCPGQHVAAVSVVFKVSLNVEPRELEGVAGLTGRCLTQGSADRSAEEFADALALCGADLMASAGPDAFTVRLSAPTTRLAEALDLMADAVIRPTFSDEEFAHEKRLRLQEIDQAHAYPQHVAVEVLNGALFGDSRVGRPTGGSTDTVAAVQRDDVVAYAKQHLRPTRATVVIAGDLTGIDPGALVADRFEQWEGHGSDSAALTLVEVSAVPRILLVDWPDAPQATVRVGAPGIDRSDARWPAMFVANYAVGGSFSARINTVLREQKGVTYGANSSLDTGRRAGLVTVGTAVRSDATAESVADIIAILREADGTLRDDEVEPAVRAATESAALGFERADAVAGRVEMLLSQQLPLDHVDANLARIRAVTTDDANRAYGSVVDAGALTIVVVGDAASVRGPLAEIGYAEVEEQAAPTTAQPSAALTT